LGLAELIARQAESIARLDERMKKLEDSIAKLRDSDIRSKDSFTQLEAWRPLEQINPNPTITSAKKHNAETSGLLIDKDSDNAGEEEEEEAQEEKGKNIECGPNANDMVLAVDDSTENNAGDNDAISTTATSSLLFSSHLVE
jgi:hypothetical protein